MKNRGYTLLELLGVIVLLALLITLVFPSILNTIKKTSDSTDKLSMDLIESAADLYIDNHIDNFVQYNGNKYVINVEDLLNESYLSDKIKISEVDNINNKCIQVTYNDGFNYELQDTCEQTIYLNSICKLISDADNSSTITAGDKYKCKVDPNKDPYTFYILTTPPSGATEVNLIMNQNINSDGTPAGTTGVTKVTNPLKYNLVEWVSKEDYNDDTNYATNRNNKGPITAMNFLSEATKTWTNTNRMTINTFPDETGTYHNMKTYNIYARMPIYLKSLTKTEVSTSKLYLYDNLNLSDTLVAPHGYWTFSSYSSSSAWIVFKSGIPYDYAIVDHNTYLGVRPVINLKI